MSLIVRRRILVCGGRDYLDAHRVFTVLDALSPVAIATGACPSGADEWARQWAEARVIPYSPYPANWDLGRRAGPIRNQKMLDDFRPEVVLAFPGGRGTADMRRRADAHPDVILIEVPWED